MATTKCDGTKVIGQTLFLGASVVSVNMNLGWGSSQSTCTVELIEDFQPITCYANGRPIDPFLSGGYGDNHYHDCSSDMDCYVDELGAPYNPNRVDVNGDPDPPKEKNVPGKIYYGWGSNGVVSKYWYAEDPGFFATGTKINPDGTVNSIANNVYDIVGVPVFFKFDNMTFTGIVRAWESNFNNGRNFYKVEIESAGSLLENSYVILDKYAGTVFSTAPGDIYGAPRNFTGELNATGTIRSGNIHNVFNVYGFLDSLGPYGFGGANKNDKGISYRTAVQALKVLTSTTLKNDLYWKSKNMFSPFGRILGKVMQSVGSGSYTNISTNFGPNAFGVIPPALDINGIPRVEFALDLSELVLPPDDSRIQAKSSAMKISEFLNQLLQNNGQLSYWTHTQPLVTGGSPYNIIKVKAVSRQNYIKPYTVNYVVGELQNSGYSATTSSSGRRKNKEANVRTMYIGGRQQRLYQAKNYRLAFNQDNYIWNPVVGQFINFRRFDDIVTDKYKIPSGLSVRNPNLANQITGNYTSIINTDETIKTLITGSNFNTLDRVWIDNLVFSRDSNCFDIRFNKDFAMDPDTGLPILSDSANAVRIPGVGPVSGNIGNNVVGWTKTGTPLNMPGTNKPSTPGGAYFSVPDIVGNISPGAGNPWQKNTVSNATGAEGEIVTFIDQSTRYIPIYRDSVCPFFGFKFERAVPISEDSNIHRYIRPVWMDSWTGQLCAAFDLNELPPISCGPLISLYDKGLLGKDSASLGGNTGVTADPTDTAAGGGATGKSNPNTVPNPNATPTTPPNVTPELLRNMNFGGMGFLITESEMRCAMAGWESYLKYCLAKSPTTKPDLFLMLLSCWQNKGVQISNGVLDPRRGMTAQSELENGPGHQVGETNVAGVAGQPSKNRGKQQSKISQINFSMLLHPGFIADLKILCNFVADMANRYYGKQFMVKIPYMQSYRDTAYSNFNIPGFRGGQVFVYSGSSKIFYQYDLTSSAWEEWGNYIDDSLVVGGSHWASLSDEKGMIPPLLGFNASDKIDYVKKTWCTLSALDKAKKLSTLRKQAVAELAPELNQMSVTLNVDRPLAGNLSNWTIRIVCPEMIDNGAGGEAPNPIFTCATEGYAELTGSETEEYIKDTLNMSDADFQIYKKFQALKRQVALISSSGPAGIECSAEEKLVEDFSGKFNASAKVVSNERSFLIPSIKWSSLGSDGKDYVVVPYNVGFISAYDDIKADPCAGGKKVYRKASLMYNSKVAFGSPEFLTDPRAIVGIPNRIELNTTSYVYEHDPNLYVMPNVAAEDIAFYRIVKNAGTRYRVTENGREVITGDGAFDLTQDEYDHIEYLESKFLTPIIARAALLEEGSTLNVSAGHRKMAPKAAQPFFAAVPAISNRFVYGPWTNYPELNKNNIWNYVANPDTIVENLVDNVKVEQKDEFVPWNYGGTSWLDSSVIADLDYQQNYLTAEENGSIKILGPPIYTIGSQFSSNTNSLTAPYLIKTESVSVNDYNEMSSSFDIQRYNCLYLDESANYYAGYPLVQGINITVGNDGVATNYTIGSYNPKMGQFNKELSDAQKNLNLKLIDLDKKVNSSDNFSNNQQNIDLINMITDLSRITSQQFEAGNLYEGGMFGNSPSELLIGQSRHFIGVDRKSNTAEDMMKNKKIESWAGLFMADEVGPELTRGYNTKAAMSLDGIFSPISFYPTSYHSTHHISNFSTTFNLLPSGSDYRNKLYCHVCKNARYIQDVFVDYPNLESRTPIDYPCPNCSNSVVAYDKSVVKPQKDKAPRVIIDPNSKKAEINFYSLNPIVVSAGEFGNPNAYPSGNISNTHSIRTVSRGESLPGLESSIDNFSNISSSNSDIPPAFEAYDFESEAAEGVLYSNNQRFFGLRGPMVIHGWGYDTDGYPVPNYSDEPKQTDVYGRHLRFIQDADGFNDLTKQGMYISTNKNVKLGDIITKRYTWDGTEWKRAKKPTKYFSQNWAAKSDTWPVGPVDLRWDHEKRVWVGGNAGCGEELLPPYIVTNKIDNSTLADYIDEKTTSGCPYKMVYVTLEQDLTRSPDVYFYTNAVRGFIDDLEYISEPLPNGYRRLVYVIDRSGYTAPAGVRLLCRYNPDLGFYEPVSKPNIIAIGVISGGQANINQAYAKSRSGSVATDMLVNYSNPLDFEVASGTRGVFSFIDGEWTLTSAPPEK